MKKAGQATEGHLTRDLLIRFLDGELPDHEFGETRGHLAVCSICRQKRDEVAQLSSKLTLLVNALPVDVPVDARVKLSRALVAKDIRDSVRPNPSNVMRRFGWAMALAASLAVGVLLAPYLHVTNTVSRTTASGSALASLDVNGESFIALPYSNPDLPLSTARIVEMEVPISSLASAGIVLEPGVNGSTDRTVAANVLLGIDGQPLGLHVLSTE